MANPPPEQRDPLGAPTPVPSVLLYLYTEGTLIISSYGWYIFFGCIAIYLLLQKLSDMMQSRRPHQTHTDLEPLLIVKQQEAMEAARRKMQAELDTQAVKYKEKQNLLEEAKRRQKIEAWESIQEGRSYRANTRFNQQEPGQPSSSNLTKPKSGKKSLATGFNALTGDGGGSCTWRPNRRGPSSGG
uniref:Selenoprotein S-like protein n=3 Tax=Callorhinchus milii TaxID=7868 RepID=V9L5J8_CALMI